MLGKPVVDAAGETIGAISDVAIATREVFPRVTSLAFLGPEKTPFMLSWRKFVAEIDDEQVTLNVTRDALRFSYLQPDEILLHRDLLNQQIVDTQGMKVVRVNDLKISESRHQLRLLGAEVGTRGILRGLHPTVERMAERIAKIFGAELSETIIAWNYMDLLDRDLSHVQLSVTHKRLHELHPADIADVLEQLSPAQRAKVFEHLDNTQAADTISELEDAFQADVIDDLGSQRASDILEIMDPDDAADVIGDLPYDKAEALLRLMGVEESSAIRGLLGYREKTAGGIMTPEVTTVTEEMTVQQVIEHLRGEAAENESIYYIYVTDSDSRLEGVISLRDLVVSEPGTLIADIVTKDVITADVEDDQEDVAEMMSKYDLLAMPVVDETGKLLGIVTVDDALDVLEEESAEDLELATGHRSRAGITGIWRWVSRNGWLVVWLLLALVVAATIPALLALLLAATIVLRIAEDVASHALSRVIEEEDEGEITPLWRRITGDALAGSGLGLLVGMVTGAIVWLAQGTETFAFQAGGDSAVVRMEVAVAVGLVYALSVLSVSLAGTMVARIAEGVASRGRRVSGTAITVILMIAGAVAFTGFTYLALAFVAAQGIFG
ncbi:MAG: magnesium transporter MgtE [Actinobacteria bacterium HGW-Actinobacteria-6]|jgi:Mg2+ transporter MgtE|nr:MAG: magnesium transporter MgtE [Actinobacteria bacterium HGW-Actinobacteria-6]